MRPFPFGPRVELGGRERGDRGLRLGGAYFIAAVVALTALSHRQRGVQRIVGLVGVSKTNRTSTGQ